MDLSRYEKLHVAAEEQRKAEEQRRLQEEAAREGERKRVEELAAAQKAAAQKAAEQKQKDTAVNAAPFVTTPLVQTPAASPYPLGASTVGETSFAGMPKPYPSAPAAIAPKRKSSSLPIAIAAVLILFVAGGGVGGYMFWKSRRTTTPPPPEKPTDPLDVPLKANLIDIPGGPFKMGRDDAEKTEGPSHQVNVNGFSMDKTEVTNLEYAQFVKQTSHAPPSPAKTNTTARQNAAAPTKTQRFGRPLLRAPLNGASRTKGAMKTALTRCAAYLPAA